MNLPLRLAVLSLLLAYPLQAQFITGTVLDPGGAPVAGVNIDVFDVLTGDPIDVLNGGTNINGFFLSELPGPGVYEVCFLPPPPPTTSLLSTTVMDVPVIAITEMGLVQLPQGFVLNGKAVDENNLPVAGVKLIIEDLATGDILALPGSTTGLFGTFAFALAAGDYAMVLDTINATGLGVLAPRRIEVSVTDYTPLGLLVLEPGFLVTARFLDAGGSPVQGVDMDAEDRLTGDKVLTLHDNSDGNGEMSVVLPRGRYDLELCPFGSPNLVAAEISPANVGADLALGNIVLVDGVQLTGTVTDFNGAPVLAADLNLRDQALGTPIALCQDNSNAAGVYSVMVPPGTYEVTVTPPKTTLLVPMVFSNVIVTGRTVLDAILSTSSSEAKDAPPSPPGAMAPGGPGGGFVNGAPPVLGPGASGQGTVVR
jgi:hypothetical protein